MNRVSPGKGLYQTVVSCTQHPNPSAVPARAFSVPGECVRLWVRSLDYMHVYIVLRGPRIGLPAGERFGSSMSKDDCRSGAWTPGRMRIPSGRASPWTRAAPLLSSSAHQKACRCVSARPSYSADSTRSAGSCCAVSAQLCFKDGCVCSHLRHSVLVAGNGAGIPCCMIPALLIPTIAASYPANVLWMTRRQLQWGRGP